MSQVPGSQPAAGLQHQLFFPFPGSPETSVYNCRAHCHFIRHREMGALATDMLGWRECARDVQIHIALNSALYCKGHIEAKFVLVLATVLKAGVCML